MKIEEKAVKAACRYLGRIDYDVLEEDFDGFIVAVDNNLQATAFTKVTIEDKRPDVNREEFEKAVMHYLSTHADTVIEGTVRYDVIRILLNEDQSRALLCHHVNACNERGGEHVDIQ